MSTNINLINLASDVKKLQDDNVNELYCLFVDLKGAFDNVNHKILFKKMEKMKIDQKVINTVKLIYSKA